MRRVSLSPGCLSLRVISDKVHHLFVALPYFRTDRVVHLLCLMPRMDVLNCIDSLKRVKRRVAFALVT